MSNSCNQSKPTRPRVVLLLSDKSSGSTIFQKELIKHAEINPVNFTPHNDYETLYWIKAACLLHKQRQDFLNGRLPFNPWLARKSLLAVLRSNLPSFTAPANDEALVFEGWNQLCCQYGPVFFEKSPHHLNQWPALVLILRYFQNTDHDVRVIGLVRNPMAVMYSAWSRWLTPPEQRQFMWAQSYRNLLCIKSLLPPHMFYMVRYEELITQPLATMRDVCDFLELSPDDRIGGDIHTRSAKKWPSDGQFTLQLSPEVNILAQHFGYTETDLYNPVKPEPSAGTRARWYLLRQYRNTKSQLKNKILKPALGFIV